MKRKEDIVKIKHEANEYIHNKQTANESGRPQMTFDRSVVI